MVDFIRLRGENMPHVIVKLWPGRNDEIKSNLAKRIAHTVAEELKVDMGDKLVGKMNIAMWRRNSRAISVRIRSSEE